MNCRKTFSFAAVLFGISPLMVHAAEPTTQPVTDTLDVSIDPQGGGGMMVPTPPAPNAGGTTDEAKPRRGDRLRAGLRFMQPYSAKETADAMQFMSQHSPQRYRFVQSLSDGESKTGIQNFATRAYESWMRLAKDNSPLYPVVLKRVELEDEIFGLVADLRSAPVDKQSTLTAQLHDKVESLVDIGIKERQLRLDDLSRTLKDEQQKLDADNADRKSLVDKRLKAILNDDHLGHRDGFNKSN